MENIHYVILKKSNYCVRSRSSQHLTAQMKSSFIYIVEDNDPSKITKHTHAQNEVNDDTQNTINTLDMIYIFNRGLSDVVANLSIRAGYVFVYVDVIRFRY